MFSDAETEVMLSAVEWGQKTNHLLFSGRNNSNAAFLIRSSRKLKNEQEIKMTAKAYLNLVTEKDPAMNPRDGSTMEGFRSTHLMQKVYQCCD